MAGAKQRNPRKEARWRKHLRRQQGAGQSVRDYCREHGLAESSFHFWRREIVRRDCEIGTRGPTAFVPIAVQPDAPASDLEVVLASGRVVRVAAGFEVDTLRRLLALLEEPSC